MEVTSEVNQGFSQVRITRGIDYLNQVCYTKDSLSETLAKVESFKLESNHSHLANENPEVSTLPGFLAF